MPGALLATKLYIPPPRPESVPRLRLLDRLDETLLRWLTLISAPAGLGKSALLSQWHASRGQDGSFVGVLLDEQDNDPVYFWSYVLAALEGARPGVGRGAATLLSAIGPSSVAAAGGSRGLLQRVVTALVNDLAATQLGEAPSRPLALALDDYHTIHAPAVHDSMAFFLEYLPPAVHLVILTRADPPLALARLRARDQLLEMRAADLRFTTAEVRLFFNQGMALNLPAEAVSTLEARTEGWAAGLRLAALTLQGLDTRQARRVIDAFAGTHRHVLGYLTEEVLQRQSTEVQAFLLQTSILPYLCAALCDAVTGHAGSQAMLEWLAGDNLFTIPLDAEGLWYRCHPPFAETLRARPESSFPGLLTRCASCLA